MILRKGETLFRQGETGPLFRLISGLLKIVRVHQDGSQILVNVIVPGEIIPHHCLMSPNPYYGTAIALVSCEVEVLPKTEWYQSLEQNPERYKEIAINLQEKLRAMQQRIDQLTADSPAEKLKQLQTWFGVFIAPETLTDVLTQDEIGQFLGLRRETINRLLRSQRNSAKL